MENNIAKKVLLGLSTVIGVIVAGSIYKTGSRAFEEERVLIGDGEVIEEDSQDIQPL